MAKGKIIDMYLQEYNHELKQTAGDGGIIEKIDSNLSAKDRVGLLVHEIQAMPSSISLWKAQYLDQDDSVHWGISTLYRAGSTPSHLNDSGVLYMEHLQMVEVGVSANHATQRWPVRHTFPEPLLLHPAATYLFFSTVSFGASNMYWQVKLMYKYKALTEDEWRELFEAAIMQNVV